MQWPQHHQAGLSSPADNEEELAKDTMEDNEQAVNGGAQVNSRGNHKSPLGTKVTWEHLGDQMVWGIPQGQLRSQIP